MMDDRFVEIQVQQRLCQMYSSDFENVTGWELNPLISLLQIIREEYVLTKPEVYRTVVAILNDYRPTNGEKHREKTLRYLRLLLGNNPELADYMSRVLPPAQSVSAQYSHCLQSAASARSALRHNADDHVYDRAGDESTQTTHVVSHTEPAPVTSSVQDLRIAGGSKSGPASRGNGTLQWPIPVRPSMLLASQKALAKVSSLGVVGPDERAVPMTMGSGSQHGGGKTQPHAMPRYLGASPGAGVIPARCVVAPHQTRVSGAAPAGSRYFILRPVSFAGTTRPTSQQTGSTTASGEVGLGRIPVVQGGIIRQIAPRVIARPTFSVATSISCRVIRTRTAPVLRPVQRTTQSVQAQRPAPTATVGKNGDSVRKERQSVGKDVESPGNDGENVGKGMIVVGKEESVGKYMESMGTQRDSVGRNKVSVGKEKESVGKNRDSPLSCIQTLVANAGAAATVTRWITALEKEPVNKSSPATKPSQRSIHYPQAIDNSHPPPIAEKLEDSETAERSPNVVTSESEFPKVDGGTKQNRGDSLQDHGTQNLGTGKDQYSVTGNAQEQGPQIIGQGGEIITDTDQDTIDMSNKAEDPVDLSKSDILIRLSVSSDRSDSSSERDTGNLNTSCVIRKRLTSEIDYSPRKAAKK